MHVLEHVQCCAAATVEQLDVIGLHAQAAGAQPVGQRVELSEPFVAECSFVMQRLLQRGHVTERSSAPG